MAVAAPVKRAGATDARLRAAFLAAVRDAGLSQQQLIEAINQLRGDGPVVAQSTVSKWMNGHSTPDDLDEVARALRRPIRVSFGENEEAPRPEWARGLSAEIVRGVSDLLLSVFLPDEQRDDAAARLQAFLEQQRTQAAEGPAGEHPAQGRDPATGQ